MTDALDETVDGGPNPGRRAIAAGAQLGKYTLEHMLGTGGMGVVWAARDPDLERSVAIKLLLSADAGAEQRARLLREARAMARLKHPNVLTVYEVDTDGDRDFIAMELVEGTSMDAWLDAGPPASEVWDAVMAAGRGLAAAHAAGLVHRDFKPHNVLRSRDGRVLVTDFGLARGLGAEDVQPVVPAQPVAPPQTPIALDATVEATPAAPLGAKAVSQSGSRRSDKILDSTLTEPGALIGTPAYMAPEQFAGAAPDPRTDQFAFCVTAWQALTGKRPFAGDSLDELRKSALAGVANVPAKLPRAVRAVLARGLAVDPAARWPDLDALLDALERARRVPRRRRAMGVAVFGVAAASTLFATTMRHRDAAPAANPCDVAFDAWTPVRRVAFEKHFDRHPNALVIANAFDEFRAAWLKRYQEACAAGAGSGANGAKHTARLNCLLGERDDLDGLTLLTDSVPKTAIDGFDLWGFLPSLEACDGDSPVAPPLLPEDRKLRNGVVALRAQIAAQRTTPYVLLEREAALTQAAKKLGWKPLLPELAVAIGSAAQWTGDLGKARAHFEVAAEEAERLAYFKIEAAARIGQLEVELDDTTDPSDAHAQKLFEAAADAVQRAGNDISLATSVDTLRARYAQSRGDLATAIDRFEHARTTLLAARGYRVVEVVASAELDALVERNAPGDLDTASRIGKDTLHALEAAHRPTSRLTAAMNELVVVHAKPGGATLDVIVRGIDAHGVDVQRGKLPKDHADLAHVGLANMTDAGAKQYARDDAHAVIRDIAPGDVTLCAVPTAGPPTCKTATLVAGVNVVVLGK